MKRTIKLAVVAALALGATSAFATNGDHLIGLGAKARGMGGVNVGVSHGAESGLANPAMITTVKGSEVSGALTAFMPKVSADMGMGASDSAADFSVIPEISYATQLDDNMYVGFGMWGTAGMGVDYTDASGMTANMNMFTELQLMQIGVPVAYKTGAFSVGITPILQYGSLDIKYDMSAMGGGAVAPGAETDIAFGFNVGAAYTENGVTAGLVYKSAIEMSYDGVLSGATAPFAGFGIFQAAMADTLEQPSELGLGLSYNMAEHTVAFDYKQIAWSDAAGYGDFGWDDQTVMALGYEYATKGWAVRLGYNKADNPISDVGAVTLAQFGAAGGTDMTMFGGNAVNMFNLLGFPATVESHITIGGSYDIDDAMSLDVAYVIAPETTTTLATMPADTTGDGNWDTDMSTTVKHSQSSLTVQVNYTF